MKKRDLEKFLYDEGWSLKRQGSHEIWSNGMFTLAIPRHREIEQHLAERLMKEVTELNEEMHKKLLERSFDKVGSSYSPLSKYGSVSIKAARFAVLKALIALDNGLHKAAQWRPGVRFNPAPDINNVGKGIGNTGRDIKTVGDEIGKNIRNVRDQAGKGIGDLRHQFQQGIQDTTHDLGRLPSAMPSPQTVMKSMDPFAGKLPGLPTVKLPNPVKNIADLDSLQKSVNQNLDRAKKETGKATQNIKNETINFKHNWSTEKERDFKKLSEESKRLGGKLSEESKRDLTKLTEERTREVQQFNNNLDKAKQQWTDEKERDFKKLSEESKRLGGKLSEESKRDIKKLTDERDRWAKAMGINVATVKGDWRPSDFYDYLEHRDPGVYLGTRAEGLGNYLQEQWDAFSKHLADRDPTGKGPSDPTTTVGGPGIIVQPSRVAPTNYISTPVTTPQSTDGESIQPEQADKPQPTEQTKPSDESQSEQSKTPPQPSTSTSDDLESMLGAIPDEEDATSQPSPSTPTQPAEAVSPQPVESQKSTSTPITKAPPPAQKQTSKPVSVPKTETTYTVRPGDTLSSIAKKHRTTWQNLMSLNKGKTHTDATGKQRSLVDPNKIWPGLELRLK